MSCKDGAFRDDQTARGKAADERSGTGFSLSGREGTRGAAVAGQVRNEDAQALFGEGAAKVVHDDVVGRKAVEQNNGTEFSCGRKVLAFDGEHLHAARGGVYDVAFFGVAAGGEIDEAAAQKKAENASKRFVRRTNGLQQERSSEDRRSCRDPSVTCQRKPLALRLG